MILAEVNIIATRLLIFIYYKVDTDPGVDDTVAMYAVFPLPLYSGTPF